MSISVEIPAFKGGWLQHCIDSVLYQSSSDWRLSLLWDGGDEESRRILEELERRRHPQVTVHFGENRGIARARHFLSANSEGDYILPLDDDDVLPFNAIERFLEVAEAKPWASVIRAQRKFIDEVGKVVHAPPWFPFEPRNYQRGMVNDVFNHSQPYLIRRSAYERTSGWEGFEDFGYAGEDCDIYLKLEEVGSVELLEETLYYYRINGDRASLVLTDDAAFEMWRRLADKTIERIGLPLQRLNERQPFRYEQLPRPEPSLADVDFVVVQDEESGSRLASRRMTDVLKRAGVEEGALRLVVRDGPGYLNVGFRESQRPLVCFVNADVDLGDPARLEKLVREMAASGADLASPKLHTEDGFVLFAGGNFGSGGQPRSDGAGEWNQGQYEQTGATSWLSERFLLVRREVARAVGGVDEGYEHDPMAVVDFCLKARQRDFDCVYLGSADFEHYGPEPALDPASDLRRLAAKWAAFPDLLAPGKD